MSKHTPGPWTVQLAQITPTSKATKFEVVTDEWDVVAGRVGIRKESDAILIASAPDLLDALDNLLSACQLPGDHCEMEQAIAAGIAAIAKAKGEPHD